MSYCYFVLFWVFALIVNSGFAQQKPGSQKIPAKPVAVKPGSQKVPAKPVATKPGSQKVPAKPVVAKPGSQKVPAKPVATKPGSQKVPAKPTTNSKPDLQLKKGSGVAKDTKEKKANKRAKKDKKDNIAVSEDELLSDLLRDKASKKRKATVDQKKDEYLILTARALIELKKEYRNFPIEHDFDDRINHILQKYAADDGAVMLSKTRDSIILIYAINYIQSFDILKKNELAALSDQLFTTINLSSGKHTNPVVIQRLNKIPQDDKANKLRVVKEELGKVIFDTWRIEIVTLLNKYQIVVK